MGGWRGETASRTDVTFFQGTDATVGYGFSCNDGTFFQGTDATVGDGFAPWDLLCSPGRIVWEGDRKNTHKQHCVIR